MIILHLSVLNSLPCILDVVNKSRSFCRNAQSTNDEILVQTMESSATSANQQLIIAVAELYPWAMQISYVLSLTFSH